MLERTSLPGTGGETVFAEGFVRAPLVSINVTNYNYARFFGDCLNSTIAQTYPETEVNIVDDVSTNNSVATIGEFIATNEAAKDFQLIALAVNGGRVITRETIRASRKDFIVKCYGGDMTRKRKSLDNQKAEIRKLRQFGKVDIPQEAFIIALKMDG